MGKMTIDGFEVEFTNEKNLLAVIRNAGIDIPTLCYIEELETVGDCRMCTVEDDRGRLFASCSEEPRDGMVIYTNTRKLRLYRKLIVELLLSAHCQDCNTCTKNGDCRLQHMAKRYGLLNVRFNDYRDKLPLDHSSPSIIRDPNKCILCGNCVRVCDEMQSIGCINFSGRGSQARVAPAFDKKMNETACVGCGQCRVFCPTGAISIHHHRSWVWDALEDPTLRVVAQVAPAVRVALGDAFGFDEGENVMGRIVTVLHRMGFDEVYDTTYGADLTIVEETNEFLDRLENGGKLPLMTSCCPAWVKFVGEQYPDFIENVSTCRSPQGMLSATVKEYFRDPANNHDGRKTVMVSIMPCTAKKIEKERENSYTKDEKDTDYVITTSELIEMITTSGIDFRNLNSEASDIPFGLGSGGGVIFGVSGGVTEAVLRNLTEGHSKQVLHDIVVSGVRGKSFIREFTVSYKGQNLSICVASSLANARKVLEDVRNGKKHYHLIEIMACPGGCIMGGGQPVKIGLQHTYTRTEGIYEADRMASIKKCGDNPTVLSLYDGFLKGREHELLHNPMFCSDEMKQL